MLRGPMMQDIHEEVLDELLNGEERRAEDRRIRREAEDRYVQQQRAYLQQAARPGSFTELNNADWGRQNNLLQNNPGLIASVKKALGL